MENKEIKANIFKRRSELRLTQNEVAEKIGISLTAYRDLESGKTRILNEKLFQIADALHISPEELVIGYKPLKENRTDLKEARATYHEHLNKMRRNYDKQISILEEREVAHKETIEHLQEINRLKEDLLRTKDEIEHYRKKIIGEKN